MSKLTRTATTSLLGLAAAAAGGAVLLTGPASSAASLTPSTVTIQAEGTDLFGNVSSSAACEADRKVVVFKVVGTRGGGDDIRFASDTTDSDGDWNTGNTGTEGKFYAKVRKTEFCARDASPTILATR